LKRNEHQGLGFAPFEVVPPTMDVIEKQAATVHTTMGQSKDNCKIVDTTTIDITPAINSSKTLALHGGKPRIDYLAGIVAIVSNISLSRDMF